jgi:hypothetical protein
MKLMRNLFIFLCLTFLSFGLFAQNNDSKSEALRRLAEKIDLPNTRLAMDSLWDGYKDILIYALLDGAGKQMDRNWKPGDKEYDTAFSIVDKAMIKYEMKNGPIFKIDTDTIIGVAKSKWQKEEIDFLDSQADTMMFKALVRLADNSISMGFGVALKKYRGYDSVKLENFRSIVESAKKDFGPSVIALSKFEKGDPAGYAKMDRVIDGFFKDGGSQAFGKAIIGPSTDRFMAVATDIMGDVMEQVMIFQKK